jgi:hypothetical protein
MPHGAQARNSGPPTIIVTRSHNYLRSELSRMSRYTPGRDPQPSSSAGVRDFMLSHASGVGRAQKLFQNLSCFYPHQFNDKD